MRSFINQSILHYATENNDIYFCELLVTRGRADCLSEDNYRQTPFILAAKRNYLCLLKLFVNDIKCNKCVQTTKTTTTTSDVDNNGYVSKQVRLATYYACYSGNYEVVRYLFESFGLRTENLIQLSRDYFEIGSLLVGERRLLKFSELNPLHVCCYKANFEIVEYLLANLENKANVEIVVNSPINEYRDSTSLEEAFKG